MTKRSGGLKKWFKDEWVDIGSPKKGGGFKKCGRKSAKGSKSITFLIKTERTNHHILNACKTNGKPYET